MLRDATEQADWLREVRRAASRRHLGPPRPGDQRAYRHVPPRRDVERRKGGAPSRRRGRGLARAGSMSARSRAPCRTPWFQSPREPVPRVRCPRGCLAEDGRWRRHWRSGRYSSTAGSHGGEGPDGVVQARQLAPCDPRSGRGGPARGHVGLLPSPPHQRPPRPPVQGSVGARTPKQRTPSAPRRRHQNLADGISPGRRPAREYAPLAWDTPPVPRRSTKDRSVRSKVPVDLRKCQSRLWESNPRPTHYERVLVRWSGVQSPR